MIKILLSVVVALLMLGCGNAKLSPSKKTSEPAKAKVKIKDVKKVTMKTAKKRMFQTVDTLDAVLVQDGKNHSSCAICGMNLVMFYKTSHIAVLDGKPIQYCSIHCLADHIQEGAELENPKVIDSVSLKPISVVEAYYVVGSKVHGTMSRVSKYAFASLDDAKKFQSQYGGKIMDFKAALEVAKEDFAR